jgi:hypothetical protein
MKNTCFQIVVLLIIASSLIAVNGQGRSFTGASGATGVTTGATGVTSTGATGNNNIVDLEKPLESGIGSKKNKLATNAGFLMDGEDQKHFQDELAYAEENDLKDLTNAKKQEILAQNACQMNLTALKEDAHNSMIERDSAKTSLVGAKKKYKKKVFNV